MYIQLFLFAFLYLYSCDSFSQNTSSNNFIGSLSNNLQSQNTNRVGEKSNRAFKMNYGSFIATWDGRIAFLPNPTGDAAHPYKWDAYVLRYENIKTNEKDEPNLQDPNIYSPLVTLDSDGAYNSVQNKLGVNSRMHITMVPDPDFKTNPYPSTKDGKPVDDLNSEYTTYRMIIMGQAQESRTYKPPRAVAGLFVVSTAEVVAKNIGKEDAEIVSAQVLQEGQVIRETPTSEPFFGFEPTMSSDGKLMLWNGHPTNNSNGFIMYSFNPLNKKGTGWSKPRHLTEMYYLHGPGSGNEVLVEGLKFSDRYPIAKFPLRDSYGQVFKMGEGYPGAYPWLSLDNSEIFCPTIALFFAARRTGYTVIGALTDYTARLVEGAINITRANVTGRGDVWTNKPEGQELEQKYNAMLDENSKPYGVNAYQRIMISPLGLFPSMWNPKATLSGQNQKFALPFSQKPYTFGLILSHSDRYVEVSLPETQDKNYILYLPMNEALKFDREAIVREAQRKDPDWDLRLKTVQYDPLSTPDISGNFQTGKLKEAQFPFEYFEAEKIWKQSREVVDKTIGLEGNSIFFKPKSFIEVLLKDSSLQALRSTEEWNLSFLFRTYQELATESLLLWDQFLFLELQNKSLVIKIFLNNKLVTLVKWTITLEPHQWQHLSLNYSNNELSLYWNGNYQNKTAITMPVPTTQRLWVGPISSKTVSTKALYSIDEFSLSKVARTSFEIQEYALWNIRSVEMEKSVGNPELILLGEKLFHDTILSKDNSISCASCHIPNNNFNDGLKFSPGVNKTLGTRNTPSLWNIGSMKHFMWDGKVENLAEQALLPIENLKEMALTLKEALLRIAEKYGADFKKIFNLDVDARNLGQALARFQETLVSPETAFDQNKLNSQELLGKGLFMGKARCASCHQGTLFTDSRFHNLGFIKNEDLGRARVTKRASDELKFKTPSLRSVKYSSPYFHDGRFADLTEVIEFYDKGGDTTLNRSFEIHPLHLTSEEKQALRVFLEAL